MKYPLTFYTDKYVSEGAAGTARWLAIFIRPKYRHDEGLYQHELVHIKQEAICTTVCALLLLAVYPPVAPIAITVFSLAYTYIPKVRLWAEVQAFKKQAKYYDDDRRDLFAHFIATRYNLDIDQETVRKMF